METYHKIGRYLKKSLHAINEDRVISRYDSKKIPEISIENYVVRLYTFSYASDNSHIVALILLKRLLEIKRINLDIKNIHRLYAMSLRTSTKLIDDYFRNNYQYATISGLSKEEFNFLEHEFLNDIKWDFHICKNCFEDMITEI